MALLWDAFEVLRSLRSLRLLSHIIAVYIGMNWLPRARHALDMATKHEAQGYQFYLALGASVAYDVVDKVPSSPSPSPLFPSHIPC